MAAPRAVPRLWKLNTRLSVESEANVLTLDGRLGHASAGELRAAADAATAAAARDLVIDLAAVDYLSSAAIKVLEALAAEQAARGHQLLVRGPSPAARLSIELAGLLTAYPNIIASAG
jgi:anti-anti-sigma factor